MSMKACADSRRAIGAALLGHHDLQWRRAADRGGPAECERPGHFDGVCNLDSRAELAPISARDGLAGLSTSADLPRPPASGEAQCIMHDQVRSARRMIG